MFLCTYLDVLRSKWYFYKIQKYVFPKYEVFKKYKYVFPKYDSSKGKYAHNFKVILWIFTYRTTVFKCQVKSRTCHISVCFLGTHWSRWSFHLEPATKEKKSKKWSKKGVEFSKIRKFRINPDTESIWLRATTIGFGFSNFYCNHLIPGCPGFKCL